MKARHLSSMKESAWSYFAHVVGNVTIDPASRLPSRVTDILVQCAGLQIQVNLLPTSHSTIYINCIQLTLEIFFLW